MLALLIVVGLLPVLFILNRRNVTSYSPYMLIGIIVWIAMLKSGVHATLAGVLLAFFFPMRDRNNPAHSPLEHLEHDLHGAVAFFILPVFAFMNAGVDLRGLTADQFLHGVPIGIALGLFVGKQVGIFGLCWLAVKSGLTRLPRGMDMISLYGTAALCGIGFTMSLFIGSLAFEETGVNLLFDERLGILVGSIASGLVGYFILRSHLKKQPAMD